MSRTVTILLVGWIMGIATALGAVRHQRADPPGAAERVWRVSLDTVYTGAIQRWNHIESMRWTIFYNYLVADTLLLLAWVAVFAAGVPMELARTKLLVLAALCLMGFLVSILWAILGHEYNVLVENAGVEGANCDDLRPAGSPSLQFGPDSKRGSRRDSWRPRWRGFGGSFVISAVPLLFACLYLYLEAGLPFLSLLLSATTPQAPPPSPTI